MDTINTEHSVSMKMSWLFLLTDALKIESAAIQLGQ